MTLALLLGLVSLNPHRALAQEDADSPGDPTTVNSEMEEVLRALRASEGASEPTRNQAQELERISLAALVVNGRQDPEKASGSVILRIGDRYLLGREGQTFESGGEIYLVKSANALLVVLEKGSGEEIVLRSQPLNDSLGISRDLSLVEMQEVPLYLAARALSDEGGVRIAVSAAARDTPVSIYLQNVTIGDVIDSIVLTHGLYMSEIPGAEIVRLHTTEEYAQDAGSFRDERTQVFTLKFPNARDVALSIRDLYGDRVQLAERFEEEDQPGEYLSEDLQQRMDRFDIIDARGQGFGVDAGGGQGGLGNRSISGRLSNLNSNNSRSFRNQGRFNDSDDQFDVDRFTAEESQLSAEQIAALAAGDTAMIEQVLRQRADIYVTVIDRLNKVMVRTRDDNTMKEICDLVETLDVPTALVLLEVKIMEVGLDRGLDTAFDWNFDSSRWNGNFTTNGPADPGDLVFTYLDSAFQTQIELLQQGNKVTILGKPMLLTANNEVSRLFIGEEVPILLGFEAGEVITTGTLIGQASVIPQYETRPVGSTLFITPNINQDKTVTLRVLQEESRVEEDGANILVPDTLGALTNQTIDIVASQTASGTFVARDKETIAIGGMITERMLSQRSQIPILGDIPVAGIFARNQKLGRERKEIVLLLTPHIIQTPGEGEELSRRLVQDNSYHPNAPQMGEGELGAFVKPNVVTPESDEFWPLQEIQEQQELRAEPVEVDPATNEPVKKKFNIFKWVTGQ